MKKIISILLVLCVLICLCSCGKTPSETQGNNQNTTVSNNTQIKALGKIKVVDNEKGKAIMNQLKTISVNEVFEDIKNIDIFLKPDFDNKKYKVKTVENKEDSTKDINYYLDGTLVYTKYEGYGEECFANYTKTVSGLDATVKYYTYSGDNHTLGIETSKYNLFANVIDKTLPGGFGNATVTLYPEKNEPPFDCSAVYFYDNGTAVFDKVTYLDEGNYVRYTHWIDQDSNEDESIDVLVNAEVPKTSDDIVKVLQEDKSYDYAAIQIRNSNKWYCNSDNWYVKAQLAITFKTQAQAEEYLKKNSLNGKIDDYGSVVVIIDNAVFKINKTAVINGDTLADFITGEIDDSFFKSITLDANGMISKLGPASIAIY